MSLRDRLRVLRPGSGPEPDDESAEPGAAGPAPSAVAGRTAREDITDFEPRSEGDYHCAESRLYLRFARPAVTESGPGGEPATGEFTSSGRFTVQRPFERPVVYTVLTERATSITVRRTDTADGSSSELTFTFEPDER